MHDLQAQTSTQNVECLATDVLLRLRPVLRHLMEVVKGLLNIRGLADNKGVDFPAGDARIC